MSVGFHLQHEQHCLYLQGQIYKEKLVKQLNYVKLCPNYRPGNQQLHFLLYDNENLQAANNLWQW
ncbi:hypothetical protein X975_20978, partial [Stegodyphus mimosarum]